MKKITDLTNNEIKEILKMVLEATKVTHINKYVSENKITAFVHHTWNDYENKIHTTTDFFTITNHGLECATCHINDMDNKIFLDCLQKRQIEVDLESVDKERNGRESAYDAFEKIDKDMIMDMYGFQPGSKELNIAATIYALGYVASKRIKQRKCTRRMFPLTIEFETGEVINFE